MEETRTLGKSPSLTSLTLFTVTLLGIKGTTGAETVAVGAESAAGTLNVPPRSSVAVVNADGACGRLGLFSKAHVILYFLSCFGILHPFSNAASASAFH